MYVRNWEWNLGFQQERVQNLVKEQNEGSELQRMNQVLDRLRVEEEELELVKGIVMRV